MTDILYGPDGRPLTGGPRIEVRDAAVTYADKGESYTADAEQLLMAMARRKRDGASNEAIISEFDLKGDARSPYILNRALRIGMDMLDRAIAEGRAPAETLNPAFVDDD